MTARALLIDLEEPYRSRAIPAGSISYWSWRFAAPDAREPLLGVLALAAEWRALADPATEGAAARLQLAWWSEEMQRLSAHAPVHPISRYLARLPRADTVDFSPLVRTVAAAAAESAGVPVERAADLPSHAYDLLGIPLLTAAALQGAARPRAESADRLRECVSAIAIGEYRRRALGHRHRDARFGRISFAVDELLAAGIDNDDLAADVPTPRLRAFLDRERDSAAAQFAHAASSLDPRLRPSLRHLPVMAALGIRALRLGVHGRDTSLRFGDLRAAWQTARRAAAGRC